MGHTSFSRSLVIGSSKVQKIYAPRFTSADDHNPLMYSIRGDHKVHARIYEFRNYINPSEGWVPTPEIKKLMISHSADDVLLKTIV